MPEETGIQTRKGIIADYLGEIEDPRIERSKEHKLIDILQIAICGVICGADGWTGIEAYGKAIQSWLETFLELPHSSPIKPPCTYSASSTFLKSAIAFSSATWMLNVPAMDRTAVVPSP